MPLDGQFRENVIVQIKNGPIDFQPREPYSPLFTAMKQTPMMVEFQITQEYLGFSNHLAYLAPLWEEFFGEVRPDRLKAAAGELVRTPFCAGQLVCFRAFGMESVVDFRQDCR